MRIRLLVIWISLTVLLQWSRAQEEGELLDKNEDQSTAIKENGVEIAAENQSFMSTTNVPAVDKEPVEASMVQSDGNQEGEMDHQSGETNVGAENPPEGTTMDHKSEEDKTEPEIDTTNNSPPPENPENVKETEISEPSDQSPNVTEEPSSGVVPEVSTKPLTLPKEESHSANETGGSPDYQGDGPEVPQDEATTSTTIGTTLKPASPPLPDPLRCYSCTFCNKITTSEPKSYCPPIPGARNGCRTMLVLDPNLIPGKNSYVNRGCISEFGNSFSSYCDKNKKLCPTCYENDCNVHNMTQFENTLPASGAAAHHLVAPFLIFSIYLFSWAGA
ncbi:LOW QUALITY PROTEIN: uncharacterized protein LOC128262254 [Drosophila gunungcola]|uniref:LOW QUALITY PROTEIN: uncharacterized protein LOC128262254 n=1 Tax=Drosophila gunungcola TaxID=103775 RepID=UPI0022E53B5A|nr:LOW QUALITY PROTEIN: uncharacterized protein LOC128262254 [Drosophila gunungcola]